MEFKEKSLLRPSLNKLLFNTLSVQLHPDLGTCRYFTVNFFRVKRLLCDTLYLHTAICSFPKLVPLLSIHAIYPPILQLMDLLLQAFFVLSNHPMQGLPSGLYPFGPPLPIQTPFTDTLLTHRLHKSKALLNISNQSFTSFCSHTKFAPHYYIPSWPLRTYSVNITCSSYFSSILISLKVL